MTSVLKLFEQQAAVQPDALAVSFASRAMTYAQLHGRARQIAHGLRRAGILSESLVALYLDRSPDLIASLLAVWQAGGAYLPIDPTNPRQRVAFTLEDSQVAFVLTERNLLDSLPQTNAKVICLEDIGVGSGEEDAPPPFPWRDSSSPDPALDQLAYVIYTSGSTGKPKGAEISHRGLANVIASIGRDVELKPSDVVVASATIAFDISNEEIFLPLTAGACVLLLERESVGDGHKLIEVMRRSDVSLVFGTPTSWRLVLEAGWQGNPKMQIIVGGEILPLSLARTLAGMTRALWNHYGPTETSICATRERILVAAESVTLGWPVDQVQIHVLDGQLQEVAAGAVGEIYIGGVGVGRGYLNRPELSRRVFLADPFESRPGALLYKTGDLGRVLPDGRLDFQGRVDNQVKLRGFRIELEEIEAAMREYAGIHAASVQLVDYGVDDQRLVAYFLSDKFVVPAALRDFLRQRLPYYMLPSELIPLESLPMTINGKIDREALDRIRLKFEEQTPLGTVQAAADHLEEKLLAIWQKLLKVRNISPSDDFFDLGGHSLLATRMFTEIERITGKRLPLSVLVRNPTVRLLVGYIHSHPESGWPGLVAIQDRGHLPPLFIAHGLGSNLLLFRTLTEELGPNQQVYGIQLAAPDNPRLEDLRLEAFAARYVEEITAVDPTGPYYLAGHSLGGLLVFEIASQLHARGKQIGLLALLDCNFHVAQRSAGAGDRATLQEALHHWRKRFGRLFESGIVNTTWRKILYNKLMFKIWLLRKVHRDGTYFPQVFGVDPYIALFAERYQPEALQEDAVLFVAEDQLGVESVASGWSPVIKGRLELQKIPGAHQTIFTRPNVTVLAHELAKRIDSSQNPQKKRVMFSSSDLHGPMSETMVECHGG